MKELRNNDVVRRQAVTPRVGVAAGQLWWKEAQAGSKMAKRNGVLIKTIVAQKHHKWQKEQECKNINQTKYIHKCY